MKIVTRTEQSLKASKGLASQLGPVLFFCALGVILLFTAPLPLSIICWALAGILALYAILIPDTIMVDRLHQEIVLRKSIFWLFPKTSLTPFNTVEAVRVGYRRTLGAASRDWQVTLLLGDSAVAVTHSGNELRMRKLGSAISRLVGVKFVSDTFRPKAVTHDYKFFFRRRWNVR